jgi:hypothetical protein
MWLLGSGFRGSLRDHGSCRLQFACLWLTSKLWQHVFYQRIGRRNMINMSRNNIWMAPCKSDWLCSILMGTDFFDKDHIYCVVIAITQDLERAQFVVSGTYQAPLNERSMLHRRSLFRRILDPLILVHTLHGLTAVSLVISCVYYRIFCTGDETCSWQTGIVIRLVEVSFAAFVPVIYMIWPPVIDKPAEQVAGGVSGISAGNRFWKRRDGAFLSWQDFVEILVITLYDGL